MMYQIALNLFKTLNENSVTISTELARVLHQVVCTRRQIMFEIHKTNRSKIGMNANKNNLSHISKLIVMDKLSWSFVLFKKHMKIQFLKFGNT